jgi:hypothetical protein
LAIELDLEFALPVFQHLAAVDNAALIRHPRANLTRARATVKIRIGLLGAYFFYLPFNADLAFEFGVKNVSAATGRSVSSRPLRLS